MVISRSSSTCSAEGRLQLSEGAVQKEARAEVAEQQHEGRERMEIITGCSLKRGATIEGDVERANQMNNLFNRNDQIKKRFVL